MPYNLIFALFGILSLLLFYAFISLTHELKPGEDAIESMALFMAPIAANICYTAGWIVELFWFIVRKRKSNIGPALLKFGYRLFSRNCFISCGSLVCNLGNANNIKAPNISFEGAACYAAAPRAPLKLGVRFEFQYNVPILTHIKTMCIIHTI